MLPLLAGQILTGLAAPLLAQPAAAAAPAKVEVMKEVWREMDVPPAPALTAEQALKTFKLAPGFRIEIVAADPLVHDPVAMALDGDGRFWVVEMRAYMPNVEGRGEDARLGSIVVLEDTNGDGRMDRRTEFLSGLQMPRAVALVKGGVLVAEPPNLWFCEDTDGDRVCDRRTAVLKDFARQGPVEHTDNGLMHGLDNWLYNAKSSRRLRLVGGQWAVTNTTARGQWGITQDDHGRIYHNSNSSPLHVDLIPTEYTVRNLHYAATQGVGMRLFGSNEVWTSRVNPGINRGYQPAMLRAGHLSTFTAACSPVVYRGDQYPAQMIGDVFIAEPAGNMVRHQKITWQDGQPKGENAYKKEEWLTSTDERFRPTNLYNGPDGCLYIVDMYRGILQHKLYITPFLRKQIIERKLDQSIGLGRIYRVVHESKTPGAPPAFSSQTPEQWVTHLSHANGWWRDTAQRLLVQQGNATVAPALRQLAKQETNAMAAQHALWTLEGLGALDAATLQTALSAKHPRVRIAALRTTEAWFAQIPAGDEETRQEMLQSLLALQTEPDRDVRRQFALTLSNLRLPGVETVLRSFVAQHGQDAIIREALITGLAGRELEFLQRAAAELAWQPNRPHIRDILTALAGCVVRQREPQRLEKLLRVAAAQPGALRQTLLDGVLAAAFAKERAVKPVAFKSQPAALVELAKDAAMKDRLARLEKFLVWGEAAKPKAPPRALTAEEQARFVAGRELYQVACATCHQANGLGEEGKAPPLLDSPFLTGSPERAIGIVLHGVTGPITLHGRTYTMSMPALQGFDEKQIAAILTYARREWEHEADPVTPEAVARVKAANARRQLPWTEKELLELK